MGSFQWLQWRGLPLLILAAGRGNGRKMSFATVKQGAAPVRSAAWPKIPVDNSLGHAQAWIDEVFMRAAWICGLCLAVLVLGAFPVHAQTVIGAKSGVINWVEGDVFLGDKPYVMQPSQFGEVKENMVLRTDEGR